jgi:ArsR family transcriptional regulator, arsenate/arsenite/antimonite-responsive transcriptional repressor
MTTVECCPPVVAPSLTDGDAARAADVFKALGHPARVRIVHLLARAPEGEVCACDLIEPTGLAQPTVSHHLKVLREAGLIIGTRRGTWVHYRLVPAALDALRDALRL